MNKNPFLPAPSFTNPQPPLPPGPPPPQPTQADYSAWWAGAAQQPHVQPPTVGPYTPQWAAPQPPRPPAEQSALYANYGYGTQSNHWQRQQQQQQQQQQLQQQQQQQQQYHPPPQVMQQPPPPPAQPAYNPYQPAAGYPQPYVPQPGPPPQPMVQGAYPHPPTQPQHMFAPPMAPQQPQHHHQQPQQPRHHHASPQHLPPAKRQRFDGPNNNNRHHPGQQHQPPQPQFQPPPAPPQNPANFSGPNRGGPPSGPGGRGGGPSGPGGRGGNMGARGGRGGSMSGNRGGLSGGRGRGGSFAGGGAPGRGGAGVGQPNGPLRGHNSRNNFSGGNKDFTRRGGGNAGSFTAGGSGGYSHQGSASFRGRNQGQSGPNRGGRNDSGSGTVFGSREGTQSSSFGGKKDENRRTLTDFKIVGLAISELGWTWGTIPSSSPVKTEDQNNNVDALGVADLLVKEEIVEDGVPLLSSSSMAVEKQTEVKSESIQTAQSSDVDMAEAKQAQENQSGTRVPSDANASQPPPSRIRIYFHTPVTADDSRPIPHHSSYGEIPTDTRKGKRKKLEDDDGDLDERRAPPPPQMAVATNDDRSSVGASAASVAETASEADWLMAAIVEGEEEAEAAGVLNATEEDDDSDQLHISPIVKEHDMPLDDDVGGDGARDEDETVHGGKQSRTICDVALGVKALPLYQFRRGGLSPRAHTADFVAFVKGNSHRDDDMNVSEHAEHDALGSSAAAGNTGEALAEPVGSVIETSAFLAAAGQLSTGNIHGDHTTGPSAAAGESGQYSANAGTTEAATSFVHDPSAATVVYPSSESDAHASESASVLDIVFPICIHSSREYVLHSADHSIDHSANPVESAETQVYPESSQQFAPKSLQTISAEPTLLDIETQDATQTVNSQMTQLIELPSQAEHFPEPPASPVSNTLLSTSSTSTTYEDATLPTGPKADSKSGKIPSQIDCPYRILVAIAEGRIEVVVNLTKEKDDSLKGILMEALSEVTKSYLPLPAPSDATIESDPTVPPFWKLTLPATLQLVVYLDTARPLSEPKWAKTGDIQDWLKSMFGRMFWVAGDAAEGWEKKIHVVDPDPPPTIWTVLDGWATNSPLILLRLVRGERATAFSQSAPTISAPSVSGPLLSALTQGSAHGAQQTHVSLAVLAMFRLTVEYAKKALGDKGKGEAEERIGEIIRCLPSHLIYKSLDGIFKEWRVEKKGRYFTILTTTALSFTTMFRNTYDSDNTVFSPQGRLHQVEYALEAVKQGSAAVGLRSKTHAVLLALKRSTGELASYQQKMFRIDDHVGIAIAGLTSDARVLSNFMRQQAMSSKMIFNRPIPVNRLVSSIADKAQVNTQEYGRRPYGVGFLVIGQDNAGPHLYEFSPSGNSYEYYAMSIGARSQSAKTYLEKHYESFADCSLEDLVRHGLHALRETLQQDKELNINNTSIGIVGPKSEHETKETQGVIPYP
ncbi:hypothetical protein BDZ97DRAFT_1911835 [Flammula alnicola]|nr:hypothetical protein BDZ97DRAFT_1911835 [Flammula alnicola]